MPEPTHNTRILVACAMKSGSTFISRTLARYYGAECIEPVPYWGRLEQNLHEHLLAPQLDRSFVLQLHLKPHVPNVDLIRKLGISVVWVWRNLGDVVVSFDDHIHNEDHRNPVCYVQDRQSYLAMPVQRRYRYLIEHALPWYLGFYLSWRATRPTLPYIETHYEQLAADPCGYFAGVIRGLGGEPDEARLRELVASRPPGTRFNKGVNGRSRELLSDYNQHLLEDKLRSEFEDVPELLAELPWVAEGPPCSRLLERAGNGHAISSEVTIAPSFPFDAEIASSSLVRTLAPGAVLAAGADAERLAEALRSLGVDAVASSSLAGLPIRCFDLIVSAAPLDEGAALESAELLERAACLLLFECAPEWLAPIARLGLVPDLSFDASFIAPGAVLFRKREPAAGFDPSAIAVAVLGQRRRLAERSAEQAREAEELRQRLATEILGLRQELAERSAEQARELYALRAGLTEASAVRERLEGERQALETAVARQQDVLAEILQSRTWRTLRSAGAVMLKGMQAGRTVLAATRRVLGLEARGPLGS